MYMNIYIIYIYIIYTHTCRYIYTKNRIESLYIYNIYILIYREREHKAQYNSNLHLLFTLIN